MPNLPDRKIRVDSPDGKSFSASLKVFVTNDGEFRVTIPDEILTEAHKISKGGVVIDRRGDAAWKACGSQIDTVLRFICEAARAHIACEVQTTLEIFYRAELQTPFWVASSGAVYGNGSLAAVEDDIGGQWYRPKTPQLQLHSQQKASSVSLGIAAKAMVGKHYVRATGTTSQYTQARPEDLDPAGQLLNSFTVIDVNPGSPYVQRMPYSPEAARFFHDAMRSVALLAVKLDAFMGDKERLRLAIEGAALGSSPGAFMLEDQGAK